MADPKEPVTITFSSWIGNEPSIKKMAADFHKQHPNITVEFQNLPAEESSQKLTAQIAGGNAPDAAFVDASTVAGFASRKALANLDNYISRSDVVKPDDYVDAFKTFITFENSMYGLPFDGESTGALLPHRHVQGRRDRRSADDVGRVQGGRREAHRPRQEAVRHRDVRARVGLLLVPVAVAERRRGAGQGGQTSPSTARRARRPRSSTSG